MSRRANHVRHGDNHSPGGSDPIAGTLDALAWSDVGDDFGTLVGTLGEIVPRFVYGSIFPSGVSSGTHWSQSSETWTITTNDVDGTIDTPSGDWAGDHFNVTSDVLYLNQTASNGLYLWWMRGVVTSFGSAPSGTECHFDVSPLAGQALGNLIIGGQSAYTLDNGSAEVATGPKRPFHTFVAGGAAKRVDTSNQGAFLKYSTIGSDQNITPTAFQDSGQSATMQILYACAHVTGYEVT